MWSRDEEGNASQARLDINKEVDTNVVPSIRNRQNSVIHPPTAEQAATDAYNRAGEKYEAYADGDAQQLYAFDAPRPRKPMQERFALELEEAAFLVFAFLCIVAVGAAVYFALK